jgi:ribose transport system substrate-binding protein
MRLWTTPTLILAATLAITSCSSSGTPKGSTASAGASTAASKTLNLAYFAFAATNSYEAPAIAAVKAAAAAANANVTVFDPNADAQKQYGEIQDALASGKYGGFLIDSIDGAGLVPIVKQALAQHIKVVALNVVLGADLTTFQPQIPGMSASIVYTAYARGQHEGKLLEQACSTVTSGDCQVGYMYDFKASGFDQGVRSGLNSEIASSPKIKIVAEGQDSFSAAGGLSSTQAMLQAHPDINVFVGADQGMQGATQALTSAGKLSSVKIIGLGGSVAGLAKVKSGVWYGDVPALPATEGRIAVQALVKALRTGVDTGGINPAANLHDGGLVTQSNVDKFTGEWAG